MGIARKQLKQTGGQQAPQSLDEAMKIHHEQKQKQDQAFATCTIPEKKRTAQQGEA